MPKFAVLASGSGSNFQKIAEAFQNHPRHFLVLLICDRKNAGVFQRAERLGIPSQYVPYLGRTREEAESEITTLLEQSGVELVVLAGFMRILTPGFIHRWSPHLVNIHPALLPRHPGAHGIADSWASGDKTLGVTIHRVDEGVDTGPILRQASFERTPDMTLETAESLIHALEHEHYPQVILDLLNALVQKETP